MLKHRKSYRTPFEQLESRSLMSATLFDQTNLVSDQFGVAQIQDKHLINPWGIALNPKAGAFWVADNDAGVATHRDRLGAVAQGRSYEAKPALGGRSSVVSGSEANGSSTAAQAASQVRLPR